MGELVSFGQWVRSRRNALGLTADDLAARVGCSTATIQKIEAGERRPSRQIAELLAEQLRIAPGDRAAFASFAHVGPGDPADASPSVKTAHARKRLPPNRLDFVVAAPGGSAEHTARPSGIITFLFTDIEGSTRLWERYPELMPAAFRRHEAILREAIAAFAGHAYKMIGDAFQAAFSTAPAAVAAAVAAQRALVAEPWGPIGSLRVRMAIDCGVVEERGDDYVGPLLNRTARLLAAGHGGQILLSTAAHELVWNQLPKGIKLRDLGRHKLKDIIRPEQIFQIVAADLPSAFPPLATVDAYPHNLPIQLTSFIGRERELAATTALLASTRLLTLAGPGGTGKTRLALQLAGAVRQQFPDGVWLIDLASLTDPALIPQTIATALGVREESGRPLLATLAAFLRDKWLLLLLDNCEHLIDACAQQVQPLLQSCPELRILATSREPLRIAGEAIFRVPALAAPPHAFQAPTASPAPRNAEPAIPLASAPRARAQERSRFGSELMRFEAVQLFVERAQVVLPGFQVTEANVVSLAQICARLDGIPLAIELAAARVRMLTVEQIAARLDDSFRLLTGGSRAVRPRHQTLQALIDWSHDLLTEEERVLLRRLTVFLGGWTLEAAEAVGAGGGVEDVLDALARLVDKSLVQVEPEEGVARYRLQETIRQYAHKKLLAAGESDAVRQRHAAYYVAFSQEGAPTTGDITREWLARVKREHDNLRAALAWNQTTAGDPDAALQLLLPLGYFWFMNGIRSELVQELERTLRHPLGVSRSRAYARVRVLLGDVYGMAGDFVGARSQFEDGLAVSRELGDLAHCAGVLHKLGWLARERGDASAAWDRLEESVAMYRQLGDASNTARTLTTLAEVAVLREDGALAGALLEESRAVDWEDNDDHWMAWVLNHLGHAAQLCGDYQRAAQLHGESLALFLSFGEQDFGLPWAYQGLGEAALARRDLAGARAWFAKGVALSQELDDRPSLSWCLAGMGSAAALAGQPALAARLWGAAEALRRTMGVRPAPAARSTYERALAAARAEIGDAGFAEAWNAGQTLPLARAVAAALDVTF